MISHSKIFAVVGLLFLLSIGVVPRTIAQEPAISIDPVSLQQTLDDLKEENAQLREQIEKLQGKIATAEALLRSTFVAKDQRGQLAAFQSPAPQRYTLTSFVPRDLSDTFLPLLKRRQIPIVDDPSQIVDDSFLGPVGLEVSNPKLISRLDAIWKSQRFIDAPPNSSLRGIYVYKATENTDDFGVLTASREDAVTYVNWDGYTKSLPMDDPSLESAYTGDLQEFVREQPSVDFVSYAALMIAHKIGHEEEERGAINLAINVETNSLSENDALTQQFRSGLQAVSLIVGSLQSKSTSITTGLGFDLTHIASRMTDELYTRFVRLGVPVVERDALDAILHERSYRKQEDFADYDYRGLLNATHLAHFEVSSPTAFGPYHIEVKLLDCNTGRVIWSDGRDRVDLTQRPSFAATPSVTRIAPLQAVDLAFNREALNQQLRSGSVSARKELYRRFNNRTVWLVRAHQDEIEFSDLLSATIQRTPKSFLDLAKCRNTELNYGDKRQGYDTVGLFREFMVNVGSVTSVSADTGEVTVTFTEKTSPKVGTRIRLMERGQPTAMSVVHVGMPNLIVTSNTGAEVIAKPMGGKFASLARRVGIIEVGDHLCFGNDRLIEAKIVPLRALSAEVGLPQFKIESTINSQLKDWPNYAGLVFPRLGFFGVEIPGNIMFFDETNLDGFDTNDFRVRHPHDPEWGDTISAKFATTLNSLRGGQRAANARDFLVPIAYQKSGRRFYEQGVLFVLYNPSLGTVEPALGHHQLFSIPSDF